MNDKNNDDLIVYAKIQTFFEAVICADLETKARINLTVGNISYTKGLLVFDLISLHKTIFPLNDVDYSLFKKTLYRGDLNKKLIRSGVRIDVWQASKNVFKSKVDGNLYCLRVLH